MGRDLRTAIQKGYGARHRSLRQRFARLVRSGQARCVRCGLPIAPNELWDLGHDDLDRSAWTGPEHRRCDRGAAAARMNRERAAALRASKGAPAGAASLLTVSAAPKVRREDRGFMSVRGPPPA